jgi:hypothetical protein
MISNWNATSAKAANECSQRLIACNTQLPEAYISAEHGCKAKKVVGDKG